MLTAAHLCNGMPYSGLDIEASFKRLYCKEADLSHLDVIDARAFVHIKDAKKLEPKSWEGCSAASANRKRFSTEFGTRRMTR